MTVRIVLKRQPETEEGGLALAESLGPLFDEFKVARWDWPALVLAMAFKHKYAVVQENAPIRRRKWPPERLLLLWVTVELSRIEDSRRSDSRICEILVAGKAPDWDGASSETLRGHLNQSRKTPLVRSWDKLLRRCLPDPSARAAHLRLLQSELKDRADLLG